MGRCENTVWNARRKTYDEAGDACFPLRIEEWLAQRGVRLLRRDGDATCTIRFCNEDVFCFSAAMLLTVLTPMPHDYRRLRSLWYVNSVSCTVRSLIPEAYIVQSEAIRARACHDGRGLLTYAKAWAFTGVSGWVPSDLGAYQRIGETARELSDCRLRRVGAYQAWVTFEAAAMAAK